MTQICQPNQQRTVRSHRLQFLHKLQEVNPFFHKEGKQGNVLLFNRIVLSKWFFYWQHSSPLSKSQRTGWVTCAEAGVCQLVEKWKYWSPEPEPAPTLLIRGNRRACGSHVSISQSTPSKGPKRPHPSRGNRGMLPDMARGHLQMGSWILKWNGYPALPRCIFAMHLIWPQLFIRGTGGSRRLEEKSLG